MKKSFITSGPGRRNVTTPGADKLCSTLIVKAVFHFVSYYSSLNQTSKGGGEGGTLNFET